MEQPETAAMTRPAGAWGRALRAAFPHTIPVLTGFLALGLAYGILMADAGFGVGWSVLMSAVAFGGSMQFVALTLMTTAFDPVQALLLSVMVNARHLFYGLSMLRRYRGIGKLRAFLIYTLCDETFSIVCSAEPPADVPPRAFYFWVSLLDYGYWVLGTFLGGVAGSLLTFDTTGLDFVLTALFTVLFIEQVRKPENRAPGFVGLGATVLSIVTVGQIWGTDNIVLPAMGLILLILLLGRNKLCR